MEIQKDSLLYSGRSEYDYIDSYENVIADKNNRIDVFAIAETFANRDRNG